MKKFFYSFYANLINLQLISVSRNTINVTYLRKTEEPNHSAKILISNLNRIKMTGSCTIKQKTHRKSYYTKFKSFVIRILTVISFLFIQIFRCFHIHFSFSSLISFVTCRFVGDNIENMIIFSEKK